MFTRVTLTLDPADVSLLDRLAKLEDSNRSEVMRLFLGEARPMLRQMVETLETALRQRDEYLQEIGKASLAGFEGLIPEVERIQDAVLGAMSRLEGRMAAEQALDPRSSNHGGHTPNPSPEVDPS